MMCVSTNKDVNTKTMASEVKQHKKDKNMQKTSNSSTSSSSPLWSAIYLDQPGSFARQNNMRIAPSRELEHLLSKSEARSVNSSACVNYFRVSVFAESYLVCSRLNNRNAHS